MSKFKADEPVSINCGENKFKGVGVILGECWPVGEFLNNNYEAENWYVKVNCYDLGSVMHSGIFKYNEKELLHISAEEYEAEESSLKFRHLLK